MKFALDAGPGEWGSAQRSGKIDAVRQAVNRTVELGRLADEAGIDSFWCLEDPDGWDAFAVLAAVARETSRLRVGTGVTNPYYRHPALLAASTTTLDLLSEGRAFLGLGRGQAEWYRTALGIPVGQPVRALRETFGLLEQWWSPEMRASSGVDATEYAVRDWERVIRPFAGHLPIYLAAVGPLALRLAGQHADGVIFNDLASFEYMRAAIEMVRDAAVGAGRNPDTLHFYARTAITITDDPETIYEQRKATVAMIHTLPGMDQLLVSPRFDVARIMDEVRAAMGTETILERGGGFGDLRRAGDLAAAKRAIPTELMAELVVTGSVVEVRQRVQELASIGVTHAFLARPAGGTTVDALRDLMGSLSTAP